MHTCSHLLSALLLSAFALLGSPAKAGSCTFSAPDQPDPSDNTIVYDDGLTRDGLVFRWDNADGTVEDISWYHNGGLYGEWTGSSGSGYVAPGFTPGPAAWTSEFILYLDIGSSSPAVIRGFIVTNQIVTDGVTLGGYYFGSDSRWIAGYGTVDCE